uniref:Proteasome activator complex subunit 4 n=1 Tax=Echinococcus granulosus TaxID=6210 RepID=A0A068WCU5_ECHGR|nr:Proteasome activator complex subunit 4 [Echinococcus granulosus]
MSHDEKYIEICRINHLLPYADQMEAYADAATMSLRESFRRLISSSTYLCHRYSFAYDIKNFIEMFGFRFTKQEYIAIVKFGLGLVFCRQADTMTRAVWAECVEFLLANAGVYIARDELQLDWKLFRNAAINIEMNNDVRQCKLDLENSEVIVKILRHAKRFFPVSCIEEIWNYFKGCIYHVLPHGPYKGMFENFSMFMPFYSWTFDEISRVWLDDIFYIWYKYPKVEISKEVISLLRYLALAFPGRIDWEPHLDRIFNFLMLNLSPENVLGDRGRYVMSHIADILVFSIGPGSSTIDRLRDLFEVCKCIYHPSTRHSSTPTFLFFCAHLLIVLRTRLQWELNACPEIATIYGEPTNWVKLTREQVDDLVDILLPICLYTNIYTSFADTGLGVALLSIQNLAALRPRLLLPRLLESLEAGILSPELPLRVTRPLMALANAAVYLTALGLPGERSDFTAIGCQPTDQPHNYTAETPRMQTVELRKYINSHLYSMSYPEGRTLVARILRCCLINLDPNHRDRLHHSILALNTLFLTIPMQDFSVEDSSILSIRMPVDGKGNKDGEQNLRRMMQLGFEASEVARANVDVEDLVVQIYSQVLHVMVIENEAPHFHVAANETEQRTGCIRDLSPSLASLGVSLAISASPVPRLRVRLVKILTDAIFQNHWNTANIRLLSAMLFWLISGRRGVAVDGGGQLPESDIALFALRQFWPRFFHLFEELDNENGLTHLSKVEPRFLTLLGVVPAYLCALVPSHLALIQTDFINPIIDVLSRLLTISIGADGAFPPSTELAQVASECASVLMFRLVTFSLNLDKVDVFNSDAHCALAQSAYLNDPLWTPYVGWREMMRSSHWNYPTPESFAVAEHVVRALFLPTLTKISAVTEELRAYIADEVTVAVEESEENLPRLSRTSGQFCTSLQRMFLISLATWMKNIAAGMFEGLKPRLITYADVEYVKKVCTELEVTHSDILSAPLSGASDTFKLNIPFFDVPAASDGSCLREQIFRVGLEFLDVFAKLSAKCDTRFANSSVRSSGQSVIGTLYCKESLESIVEVVATACANISLKLWEPLSTCMFSLLEVNIGSHSGVLFDKSPLLPAKVHKICGMHGTSRALLAAYADGEAPSLRCGGGGCFGMSYLPLAWLLCARKQHTNFVCTVLHSAAVWPGSEATALFTRCRLPANSQSLRLVDICARIGLTSNKNGVFKLAMKVFKTGAGYYIPGAVCLVAQLTVDTLKKLCGPDFLSSENSVYRTQSYRRKRAIFILHEFLEDIRFVWEISSINPRLWAEIWVAFAKSALFPSVSPRSTSDSSILPGLSQTQLTERYNDQEEISHVIKASFSLLQGHHFPLYFPVSFEVEAHPHNSPLRRLIVDALSLFKVLGGSEANMVKETPFLLVDTMALRREAYRFLTNALYTECLEHADTTANYMTVVHILSCYPFMADDSDNAVWEAALPKESGGAEFKLTAPPPPPPRTALVGKVLDFLTSQHTSLASAAANFIASYLRLFLLRSHAFEHIFVDPGAVDLPVSCHSNAPGLMLEPRFECLSSKTNFTRANHIYNLSQPFFYFEPPKTWVDPLYTPAYPTFSGPDESELVRFGDAEEWLKPRSEMDCSSMSPEDVEELRSGLIAVANHVAKREFWFQLSRQFLYFHRCDSKIEENVWLLVATVIAAFGPRPFLQRLEDFIMALIQPALSKQMDGVTEFVGPTLATHALQGLLAGSLDWPREARLALFARVLPRLLVSIEAASQLASTQPILEAPHGVIFITSGTTAVGGSFSATFGTTSTPNDGNSASDTSMNDRQAYRILSETWNRTDAMDDHNIDGPMIAEQNTDCAGPKTRLPFPIMFFVKIYADRCLQHFIYLSYIWRFFCELASDVNGNNQNELFAVSEIDDKCEAPVNHCGHRVPAGHGECPVCLGRRLFPLLEQRRALMYQVSLLLVLKLEWGALHLLKHVHAAGSDAWETLACSVSLWTREDASITAGVFASAGFDATLMEAPPTLRLYAATPSTDCPQTSEHLVSSLLEAKLIEPLAASAAAELLTDAVVGPEFVMRRFLPLLVRDSLTVLVLKGVVPSKKSFALQNDLLANAVEKLTPVTPELLNCSSRMKWLVSQQIKARLSTLVSVLPRVINGAFSTNPALESVGASRDAVLLLLAPLLADVVSSSNFFWTAGKSVKNEDGKNELNKCIATALRSLYGKVSMGHTCAELSLTQANRMLDIVEVFLLHSSWKTRIYGLKLVRRLVVCNICSFWRRDAHGKELRARLKSHLNEALTDPWIEVARDASDAIAYILQLGILKYEDQWFRHLVKESRVELRRQGGEKSTKEGQRELRRRHAGVLGLCAFIKAREHDTPHYLPEVITEVAEHAHDPQPIAKSVADTLTAYSRCHHWDRTNFSEAQLEAYLSVAPSVSYYV